MIPYEVNTETIEHIEIDTDRFRFTDEFRVTYSGHKHQRSQFESIGSYQFDTERCGK